MRMKSSIATRIITLTVFTLALTMALFVKDVNGSPTIRFGRDDNYLQKSPETHSERQQDLARDVDRLLQEIEQEELKKGAPLNSKDYQIFVERMSKLSWFQEYSRLIQDKEIFAPDEFSPVLTAKLRELRIKLALMNGYRH